MPWDYYYYARKSLRPIAIYVACSVVCVSVCWTHGWAVQKRLNRSRCHLGADLYGSKEPCIKFRSRSPQGKGHVWEGRVPAIVKYRDYAAMRSFAKLLWTFVSKLWHARPITQWSWRSPCLIRYRRQSPGSSVDYWRGGGGGAVCDWEPRSSTLVVRLVATRRIWSIVPRPCRLMTSTGSCRGRVRPPLSICWWVAHVRSRLASCCRRCRRCEWVAVDLLCTRWLYRLCGVIRARLTDALQRRSGSEWIISKNPLWASRWLAANEAGKSECESLNEWHRTCFVIASSST